MNEQMEDNDALCSLYWAMTLLCNLHNPVRIQCAGISNVTTTVSLAQKYLHVKPSRHKVPA